MARFAIDYDDTFTEDRPLFRRFISDMLNNPRHSATLVTLRPSDGPNGDIEADAKQLGIEIVYCNGRQKSSCFEADIWIDDMPSIIPSLDVMEGIIQSEKLFTKE